MNKYNFDKHTEELLFKNAVPYILHDGAQFENIPITLLQTENIMDNTPVSGLRATEIVAIHNYA